MDTVVIAHRGGAKLVEHENTLEAFQAAIDVKSDYAEFDVRRTKDEKLIVFHDDKIKDTSISNLTYYELCNITKKENYRVPLLEEVLLLCKDKIKLDIELKEAGYEKSVIDMVTKLYDYDSFLMKSFNDRIVANIKEADPKVTAGLLVGRRIANFKRRFNEYFPERRLAMCKADFISPNFKISSFEFIKRMHRKNLKIYVWTVNDIVVMNKLTKYGADGIISDRPDICLYVRDNVKDTNN